MRHFFWTLLFSIISLILFYYCLGFFAAHMNIEGIIISGIILNIIGTTFITFLLRTFLKRISRWWRIPRNCIIFSTLFLSLCLHASADNFQTITPQTLLLLEVCGLICVTLLTLARWSGPEDHNHI
jgi:ABC-type uncharacterized transport system permease subunit